MSALGDHKKEVILEAMASGVVTAEQLARRADCCERTVYRYVRMLRAEGHNILSGPGYGYMLRRRAPLASGVDAHG